MIRSVIRRVSLRFLVTAMLVSLLTVMAGMTWLLTYRNGRASLGELKDHFGRLSMIDIRQNLEAYLSIPDLLNEINSYPFSEGSWETVPSSVIAGRFASEIFRHETVMSIAYASERGSYVGMTRGAEQVPLSLGVADPSTDGRLVGYVSDTQGFRGPEFDRSPGPFDPRQRPWYAAALSSPGPVWTPVYQWLTGEAGIDLVTAVHDSRGVFRGVLDTSLTLEGIGAFLQGVLPTPHSQAFIMEPSGLLIGASGEVSPYLHSNGGLMRLSALDSSDPVIRASAQRIAAALSRGDTLDVEKQMDFDLGGKRHVMRAGRYRDSRGLDWLFAEVIPESDFAQPLYDDMRSTAVFVAVFLLASVLLSLLLAGRVTDPLKALTAAARRTGRGEFADLPVSGTREVSQLAASFNAMASRLERSFHSLAQSERRYRAIFHRSAVSLLEADVSRLHDALQELAARGITDVESFLRGDRDYLQAALKMIHIVDANETAVELLGAASRDDLLGPLKVQLDEEAMRGLVPSAIAGARKGRQQGLETRITTLSGATREIILSLYVPAEDEELANTLISVVDITQRSQAERERAALQEELRQAQKVETVGRLAGGIAHDINNLLTPILAGAEMLSMESGAAGEAEAERAETARQVLGSANRIRELTRKLLAFSRKQALERHAVHLDRVTGDFLALLRRMLRPGIDLRLVTGEDTRPALVDVGQVEQVLMNLVLNAQDAMPAGGTVTLDVRNAEEAGVGSRLRGADPRMYVAVTVTDTGSGMDATVREHLFEPFFTTKAPGKGTGLGLSTVYGIVRQHDGHILVDSDPGWGTRFRILFPCVQGA